MPVLFKQKRRLPAAGASVNTIPRPSVSSVQSPQQFHRADSGTSRRTFHSINTNTSAGTTVIQKPPNPRQQTSLSNRSVDRKSATGGIASISDAPKQQKTRWQQFLSDLKQFYKRRHIKYLFPLFAVLVYMLFGATLFYWLESGAEESRLLKTQLIYEREHLLLVKRMEEILSDSAAQNTDTRRKFIVEAINHYHEQMGIDLQLIPEWTFTTAMYFAGTLFTTIGYGDVACQTAIGRVVTVMYGLIGIPIMLMTLNDVGKFLYKSINELLDYLSRKLALFKCCFTNRKKLDQVIAMEQGRTITNGNTIMHDQAQRVSFNLRLESEDATVDQLSLDMEVVGTQGEPSDDAVFNDDDEVIVQPDHEAEFTHQGMQNMPVTVALGITIGWIFFCAALFKLWEDWTYAESWYFMFISMSTIGLGDISVKRRDMMVLCFVFVIIGLSLVSMCINVIQAALEDLYKRMLMKLLIDYQATLSKDGDHKSASIGMMKMWGHSKTAKYLMPMLSADSRRHIMVQLQEEADDAGIALPPIFADIDDKTGMPKILAIAEQANKSEESERMSIIVNDIVRQADPTRTSAPGRSPLPTIVYYEADTQTNVIMLNDNGAQTSELDIVDSWIQTDNSIFNGTVHQECQTHVEPVSSVDTQTSVIEVTEAEVMTSIPMAVSLEVQTDRVHTSEQQLQTHIIDCIENEIQTDNAELKNIRSQTDSTEYDDKCIQTDTLEELGKSQSRMTQARKKIRRAFRRRNTSGRRLSQGDALTADLQEMSDENNSAGSYESLDWDPVDGLHAEKQRPVSDLKRLFDSFKEPNSK